MDRVANSLMGLLRAAAEPDPRDTSTMSSLTAAVDRWISDPCERQRIGDLADLLDAEDALYEQALAAVDRDDTATAEALLRRCADLRIEGAADLLATLNHQRHDDPLHAEDLDPDHLRTDTVLAAGTGIPRRAGVCLARSRGLSRAADSAVEVSESLAVPGRDLRVMSHGDREETMARVAELRELLSRCPAGAFGAEGSAMVLATVATLSETLIADRDERTALRLVRAASPHLGFLGRRHPAVLEVRRVWAEALSELGWYPQAEKMLRRLSEDEQRVFGSDDPRTALLLLWALVGSGRLQEAEGGFRALEDRLTQSPDADTLMLRHLQCRHSWLQGQLGLVDKSVSDYARVITSRTNELGEDHADTLDARHSQGKILVVAGQGSQALPFLQAVADDRACVQGDRHPDTLETLKYLHLAHVQAEPRDDRVVDRAINNLLEILHIQDERHGPEYPMNRDTAAWLRKLLHRQDEIRFREQISDLRQIPTMDEGQSQTIPMSRYSGASRNA